MNYDKNFTDTFNEYYPFERYIIRNPQPISTSFDDILLTEIFVRNVEIKPLLDDNGNIFTWTRIEYDDVCVKVVINGVEARLAYYDFDDAVREEIRGIVYEDFGQYEWQSLYVAYEDEENYNDLKALLREQKQLIEAKYGECNVKKYFDKTDTIKLLEQASRKVFVGQDFVDTIRKEDLPLYLGNEWITEFDEPLEAVIENSDGSFLGRGRVFALRKIK